MACPRCESYIVDAAFHPLLPPTPPPQVWAGAIAVIKSSSHRVIKSSSHQVIESSSHRPPLPPLPQALNLAIYFVSPALASLAMFTVYWAQGNGHACDRGEPAWGV